LLVYPCCRRLGGRRQKLTDSLACDPEVERSTARTGVLSSLPFSRSRSSRHSLTGADGRRCHGAALVPVHLSGGRTRP